jgi:LacI family transcriptional regulator
LFSTHSLAIEGLKHLRRIPITVPQQLAIVSFDENDAFDLYGSPISFIRQPLEAIGAEAVRILIENIRYPMKKYRIAELQTQLVIRESSGMELHKAG